MFTQRLRQLLTQTPDLQLIYTSTTATSCISCLLGLYQLLLKVEEHSPCSEALANQSPSKVKATSNAALSALIASPEALSDTTMGAG